MMKKRVLFKLFCIFCALLGAAFSVHAMVEMKVKPGPDEGGVLKESIRNEVEAALDRGVAWLQKQQTEDGSFGGTNRLIFTVMATALFDQRGLDEAEEQGKKWFQQFDKKEFVVATTSGLMALNPLLYHFDARQIGWRDELALSRLSKQIVARGVGFWKASDVGLRIENGKWKIGTLDDKDAPTDDMFAYWTPHDVHLRAENYKANTDSDDATPDEQASRKSVITDFEATVFVLMQLMEL